jgi:hypothetical protein
MAVTVATTDAGTIVGAVVAAAAAVDPCADVRVKQKLTVAHALWSETLQPHHALQPPAAAAAVAASRGKTRSYEQAHAVVARVRAAAAAGCGLRDGVVPVVSS